MKKIKKILSVLACCVMIMVSCFSLTACSEEEIKEKTENATETTIETATSIIPVEFGRETAMGMLTAAYRNFIAAESYELTGESYTSYGNAKFTEIGLLNSKSDRFIYEALTGAEAGDSTEETIKGKYQISEGNAKLLKLNLKNKKYTEISNGYFGNKSPSGILTDAFIDSLEFVTSARYYQGQYYVTAVKETEHKEPGGGESLQLKTIYVYEYVIEDNMIVGGSITKLKESSSNSEELDFDESMSFEVFYSNVDTSMIVTTLDGFTAQA